MKTGFLTAACALFLACSPACAHAEGAALTIGEAVKAAMDNNGDLSAARREMGIREAAKVRAGLWPNPEIEAGVSYAGPGESTYSAGVSQEFITGGKARRRVAAAEKEMAGYSHELKDMERRLTEDVKTAYLDAVSAGKGLELSARAVELCRELVRVAGERLAEGDIPELELSLAEVELGRAEEKHLAARYALDEARTRLFTLMGVPGDGVELVEPPLDMPDADPEEMKALALASRPDVKALAGAGEKARADLDAATAGRWPNVTASLFYERENSAIESGDDELTDGDNFFGFRLTVPIPLFDRDQDEAMEARANMDAAEARGAFLAGKVAKEVAAACRRLETAKRAVELYEGGIMPRADENLRLTREAYSLGETGILSIIEEQRKFVEISERHIAARRDAARAAAALEAAVGAGLEGGGR